MYLFSFDMSLLTWHGNSHVILVLPVAAAPFQMSKKLSSPLLLMFLKYTNKKVLVNSQDKPRQVLYLKQSLL